MTLQELESQVVVLEAAVSEFESQVQVQMAEVAKMKAANDELATENAAIKAENKKLDKELTLLKTNAAAEKEKAEADAVVRNCLKDCKLPEKLQEKIKGMLDYNAYRKDGLFDRDAFSSAFSAEVKDWEENLPVGSVVGLSQGKEDDAKPIPYSEENNRIFAQLF